MKKVSTLFLRLTVWLMGLVVLVVCFFALRDALDFSDVDMFSLLFGVMVIAAIPFYIALYQTQKLLNYIDANSAFSELSVKALGNIRNCAVAISIIYVLALPFIFYIAEMDDAPGLAAIGLVVVFASAVIAVFASVLQKLLRNAIDIKKENDLMV